MGCGLFLEGKSLVRAFIRGKPDDECNEMFHQLALVDSGKRYIYPQIQ